MSASVIAFICGMFCAFLIMMYAWMVASEDDDDL